MLLTQAVLQIFCWQGSIGLQCMSKQGIIKSNIHKILQKVNQVVCIMYLNCMIDAIILAPVLLQIFYQQDCFTIRNASRKREKIKSNIYRTLSKVNQVIYTLDTMYLPNFMILSQAVLQVFCWQGPLWVKFFSRKRGIIQSNIHKILQKVNQIIYIMYLNCLIDAIILAQAVLQVFCWQDCFTTRNASLKREIIQSNIYTILPKVNQVIYTLDTMCMPNFMILSQAVLQIFCWQGPLWVKCLSWKREIIQSNIQRILGKVNHVICIMYPTVCLVSLP